MWLLWHDPAVICERERYAYDVMANNHDEVLLICLNFLNFYVILRVADSLDSTLLLRKK